MASWEITLDPDEVSEAVKAHVKAKYGIDPKGLEIEAVNDWPIIIIKMGKYPPESGK